LCAPKFPELEIIILSLSLKDLINIATFLCQESDSEDYFAHNKSGDEEEKKISATHIVLLRK